MPSVMVWTDVLRAVQSRWDHPWGMLMPGRNRELVSHNKYTISADLGPFISSSSCFLTGERCEASFRKCIPSGQDTGPEVGQPISSVCKGRSWFCIFHVLMWHDDSGKPWWEVREVLRKTTSVWLVDFSLVGKREGLIFDSYFESCSVLLHWCMSINKHVCGQLTCTMFWFNMSYCYNTFFVSNGFLMAALWFPLQTPTNFLTFFPFSNYYTFKKVKGYI